MECMSKSALLRNLPPEQQPRHCDPSGAAAAADGGDGGGGEDGGDGGGGGGDGGGGGGDTSGLVGIAVSPWLRWAALREAEVRRRRPEPPTPLTAAYDPMSQPTQAHCQHYQYTKSTPRVMHKFHTPRRVALVTG